MYCIWVANVMITKPETGSTAIPPRLSRLNPRRSLRVRIVLIVASLTLVLSVVLTTITGQISSQQLERNIGQNLANLSSDVVGQLDQMMFERWREMRIIAFQSTLFASTNDPTAARDLLNQLQTTFRYYAWIGWADPSGKVVAGTNGWLEGQNVAALSWFQQAQTLQVPYVGNVQELPLLSELLQNHDSRPNRFIDISMAIRAPNGTLLGVLGAYLDWRFMIDQSNGLERQFDTQVAANDTAQPPIQVFILAADGTVLIGPPAFNAPTLNAMPKLELQSLAAARSGKPNYAIENWPDTNSSYLTGYAQENGYRGYPGLGWIVLIREQADLALASVSQLQVLLLAIGVVFALVFSGLGWLLAVRITHPLVHVAQRAREIKTGDIQDTLPVVAGNVDEVEVLSNTIDRLLVSLNTRNTQLTELNANLEQTIHKRTAELVSSQRFNEKIVSTVPDLIYIFDVGQGRNIYISQAAGSLTGYSAEEMQTILDHLPLPNIHPSDLKAVCANQERMCHVPDGELIEQTYRIRHRSGQWIWVHTRESVFARDPNGQVIQVFGVAQNVTLRKQAEDKLQEAAAAQERQRLARELHDSVTQTIFSASVAAQTLPLLWDQGEAVVKSNLAELARLTRGALAEMRTLLNELRPAAIATADLNELLNQLVDAARGRTQAECRLTFEGEGTLPPEIQVSAYRVAQEALNNITKHARAKHVQIVLKRNFGSLEMRIVDDGRGFNQDEVASTHFGLGIMYERAKEVGAQLTIHSQPGHGTEVSFAWRASEIVPELAQEIAVE